MRTLRYGLFAASAIAMMSVALASERIVITASPLERMHRRQRRIPRAWRRSSNLNRSQHWMYADTYKHARRIAPMPHCLRPVC